MPIKYNDENNVMCSGRVPIDCCYKNYQIIYGQDVDWSLFNYNIVTIEKQKYRVIRSFSNKGLQKKRLIITEEYKNGVGERTQISENSVNSNNLEILDLNCSLMSNGYEDLTTVKTGCLSSLNLKCLITRNSTVSGDDFLMSVGGGALVCSYGYGLGFLFGTELNPENQDLVISVEMTAWSTLKHRSKKVQYYVPKTLKTLIIKNDYSIFYNAFQNMSMLERIIIINVEEILEGAFDGCTSLKSVIIPKSVRKIERYAFTRCPNLTIYCEAASQPSGWDYRWNPDNRPVVWGYTGGAV